MGLLFKDHKTHYQITSKSNLFSCFNTFIFVLYLANTKRFIFLNILILNASPSTAGFTLKTDIITVLFYCPCNQSQLSLPLLILPTPQSYEWRLERASSPEALSVSILQMLHVE